MSEKIEVFYNIFWRDVACYNLFMLSRDELLEIEEYSNGAIKFYNNKIIISNKENDNSQNVIAKRNDTQAILVENNIKKTFDKLEPMIKELLESNFGKAFKKLKHDLDNNGFNLFLNFISALLDEKNRDEKLLKLIKKYGFVKHNINSFQELGEQIERLFTPSRDGSIINQETVIIFNEVVKIIRELLANHAYKKIYSTNQILINSLNKDDNYRSRVLMFSDLYDAKIVLSSESNSFIECTNCDSEVLKGAISLKINPKKLEKFICPACNNELTYHATYELANDIFELVKSKDGILLNALSNLLITHNISHCNNKNYLNDIEIDCIFELNGVTHIVESKMFKLNTEENKHLSKMREAFGKLLKDIKRLESIEDFKSVQLKPMLMVNIENKNRLAIVNTEFKGKYNLEYDVVYSLKSIKELINNP